jgi:transmembrane sensor
MATSLVLCGTLALGWHWSRTLTRVPLDGTTLEGSPSGFQTLTLPDGSRIQLGAGSRLVIDEYRGHGVQLSLKKGQASFDVTHQTARTFRVLAGDFEISVVGTRFAVALGSDTEAGRVTVKVTEGKVSIRDKHSAPHEEILAAGQLWSAAENTVPNSTPSADVPLENRDRASESPADAPSEASYPSKGPSLTSSEHAPVDVKSSEHRAKELFASAEHARLNGNLRESADAFNRLRKTFRSDRRAGLAAFQLGRVRMDIFGDITGSIEALNDAISLSPSASFREDAEARLVQLYNQQGNQNACRKAKANYLDRYPRGTANDVVSRLCTPN